MYKDIIGLQEKLFNCQQDLSRAKERLEKASLLLEPAREDVAFYQQGVDHYKKEIAGLGPDGNYK